MLAAEVIEDLAAAEAFAPAWDEYAVACSLPMCSPGWVLAWWRAMAPPRTALRIIAICDGDELLAVAPWFVQEGEGGRVDLRFLGTGRSDRVDILCRAGREQDVLPALRAAIGRLDPRPDLIAFEAVSIGSQWTRRLASGWRGHLTFQRYRNSMYTAPTVSLPEGPPGQWLAQRSSNFRGQMNRMRRRLERQGGTVRRLTDADERREAVGTLLELHAARWEGREQTHLTEPGVEEMLRGAVDSLEADRLRLWVAEIDGKPISVQLFVAAGVELKYWNGGWSEEHADVKPAMLTILAALEDAIARGQRRLDLGAGNQPYKLRFADGEDPLTWGGVIVRNPRWPRTAAELAPRVLRYRGKLLARRLPAPLSKRIETVVKARRGAQR
jgi:CelD/BcsL family acetyltransferase involved in cellulose biosynthesis